MNTLTDEKRASLIETGNRQLEAMMSGGGGPVSDVKPEDLHCNDLVVQLRAGLHISTLDANEKRILADRYGKDWFVKWGYTEEDLTDIVTTNPKLL